MSHQKIISELRKGDIKPFYLLMGEEPYFIDEITKVFEDELLDEAERTFNLTVVYGRDTDLDQLVSSAKGFPMMGERQIFLVKEAQSLPALKKAEFQESLVKYLEKPQLKSVVVLAMKHKKMDKRTSLYKQIKSRGVVFESNLLKEYKIPEWISAYITKRGYSIQPDASRLLSEFLGNKLGNIVNELNKLEVIIPKGFQITTDTIEKNIGISKDYNVFELQKALSTKNTLKANQIIQYFAANPKEHPIQMLVPSLYSYFLKIIKVHTVKNVTGKNEIAGALGVPPYFVDEFLLGARNYSIPKLRRIMGYLRDCDKKSKGVENVTMGTEFLMKELVFKILH